MAKPNKYTWDKLYTFVLVANVIYFIVMYLIMTSYS